MLLFLVSSLAFAKPPATTPASMEATAPAETGYALPAPELDLMRFLSENCTGMTGAHPGTCGITIREDGFANVTPPAGTPCVPDLSTDSCIVPNVMVRLNAGNPIRAQGGHMGCSDRSTSVVTCTITLTESRVTLMNFKAGTTTSFETATWLFSEESSSLKIN